MERSLHTPHFGTGRWLPLLIGFLLISLYLLPAARADDTAENFDLQDYRGKVVWVDFWASWCTPCRRSFPWLNKVQEEYRDLGLVIVGINLDRENRLAEEFLQETPAQFPIVFDPDGQLAREFEVLGMPSSYLIDRDGQIVTSHIGFKQAKMEEYEASIRATLKQ